MKRSIAEKTFKNIKFAELTVLFLFFLVAVLFFHTEAHAAWTGCSVTINDGAATTDNSVVKVHLTAALNGSKPQPKDGDRKSTRLNSSHRCISYAVFCLDRKSVV